MVFEDRVIVLFSVSHPGYLVVAMSSLEVLGSNLR